MKPDHSNQIALHVVGVVMTVLATIGAFMAAVAVSFGTSYRGEQPANAVRDLRLGLAVVTAVWTAVPLGIAGLAHLVRAAVFLWIGTAIVFGTIGAAITTSAQPGQWCF